MTSQTPGARLLGRTGEFAGLTYRVGAEAILGRGADADVTLDSPYLSGRHARIYFENGDYFIEDLGSSNGTRVDGVAVVRPVCLKQVNVITLAGAIDLIFIRAGSAAAQATPEAPSERQPAPSVGRGDETVPGDRKAASGGAAPVTRFDLTFSMAVDPRVRDAGLEATWVVAIAHADGTRQVFPLKPGDNVLGRSAECDVVLPDPEKWLSRRHATLTVQPDGVRLTDHGTVNGTYVGEERVQTTVLAAGASFRVGPHLLLTLIRQ